MRKFTIMVFLGWLSAAGWMFSASAVFPVAEIRPGLKGVGKTCLRGREVVDFQAEVLGVLSKTIAGSDVILMRLGGQDLEKTGVISGMSGSPVYIDGRLVGAVAYAFPYSTEPVAGVTPFESMWQLFEQAPNQPPASVALSGSAGLDLGPMALGLARGEAFPGWPGRPATGPGPAGLETLRPIETPLSVSGIDPRLLESFAPRFRSLGFLAMPGSVPVDGAAGAAPPRPEPGSAIVISLVKGDFTVGAGGTVTEVDGDTVYAFGHPFLSLGGTRLAMHDSEVIACVRNLNVSLKFFTTGQTIGAFSQDRALGVYGRLHQDPDFIPVSLSIGTSRNQTRDYRFEVVRDPVLSGFLLNLGLANFLTTDERQLGHTTVELDADIILKDGETIRLRNLFSGAAATIQQAAAYVAVPVQYIMLGGFPGLEVAKVDVRLGVREEARQARIDRVTASRDRVKPGESVLFKIDLMMQDGSLKTEEFPLRIPETTRPGPIQVFLGDGATLAQLEQQLEPGQFMVYTPKQLVQVLKQLRQNGTIYLKLYRRGEGLYAKGKAYPDLPPSYLEIFDGARIQGSNLPFRYLHYLEQSIGNRDFAVSGAMNFQLTVEAQ